MATDLAAWRGRQRNQNAAGGVGLVALGHEGPQQGHKFFHAQCLGAA